MADKFDTALRRYDSWRAHRNELGRREYEDAEFDADEWQDSDDMAVELLDDLATLLTEVLGR
jgi:hypothetical protein